MPKLSDKNLTGWKNVGGTKPTCKCGSWLDHWLNYSDAKAIPENCSISGCTNKVDVGGHMRYRSNQKEYIIPICQSCNKQGTEKEFNFVKDTYYAIANRSKTCDK